MKLIEAMKKGSRMTVKGVSEQGTGTTVSYSLIGLSQALQELASGCRKT
ncbi:MAG: invasion associated locus B family protein [Hyphomicrobiaceae bacterium]